MADPPKKHRIQDPDTGRFISAQEAIDRRLFVTEFPAANAPASKPIRGGTLRPGSSPRPSVIVRNNIATARKDIAELRRRVPAKLIQDAEQRAIDITDRIRAVMELAYTQGTGRAARGVTARVRKISTGDSEGAAIVISAKNYREMRYLTNLGGRGYFKSFPVGPYRIFAKGAQANFERVNSATGQVSYLQSRSAIRQFRGKTKGRLKIPKNGVWLEAVPGRGGMESRKAVGIPQDATAENIGSVSQFFYPLWVNHPGFPADVISHVVQAEGAAYVQQTEELVRMTHVQLGKGSLEFFSFVKSREPVSTMVVSDIIPLPTITLSRSGLKISGTRGRTS